MVEIDVRDLTSETYNSKTGIQQHLADYGLLGLHQIIDARWRAVCADGDTALRTFFVLGAFALLERRVARPSELWFTDEAYAQNRIPMVMDWDDFDERWNNYKREGASLHLNGHDDTPILPPPNIVDGITGKGFSLDDCYHIVVTSNDRKPVRFDLSEFEGVPLKELPWRVMMRATDAYHKVNPSFICNDRFVDNDTGQDGRAKNPKGMRFPITAKLPDISEEVVQPGDHIYTSAFKFYHRSMRGR